MVEAMQGQAPNGFVVTRIGVIGLGHMGHAFAVNLVEDGHQVLVDDRDPKRSATVTGARAAVQLADLAACDVVLTSLSDDDALAAVALGPQGLAGILAPGSVHISTSTVSPAVSPRSMRATIRSELDWSALGLLAAVDAGLGDGR
jgi:3-hydroxyisobutyrate dehydrogenase-like beta-hydroxyacid dehydrogenase